MLIAIGSDHAGVAYKAAMVQLLSELGHTVRDFGTDSEEAVDYPDYIRPVARLLPRASSSAASSSAAPATASRW